MIDTDAKLSAYLPVLQTAAWLALDTEADSLHAYPEKVCLIQTSTPAGDELIDPLAKIDLAPLFAALQPVELIFHAADYDLRLLSKHHGFIPSAIFDTMLAARLLGERQFGLGALVEKHLGIKLDKGPQKADWAQRPLTERMEIYARNDTHYLKPLSDLLRGELQSKGRLEWHRESCARLVAESSRLSEPDPDGIWRIKGSTFLTRRGLAVLRELWHWREREAVQANRPPFFVLAHEKVIEISSVAAEGLAVDELLPLRLHPRRREGVLKAIRTAQALPEAEWPQVIRHHSQRPSEAEFRRFRELEQRRDQRAAELGIDPTLIAPKATLGDLARDRERYFPELMRWQQELLQSN